jgi:hypothetical protein
MTHVALVRLAIAVHTKKTKAGIFSGLDQLVATFPSEGADGP